MSFDGQLLMLSSPSGDVAKRLPYGVNLDYSTYYWSDRVFSDRSRQSGNLTAVVASTGADAPGVTVPVDDDGYPIQVPFLSGGVNHDCRALLFAYVSTPGYYPNGLFHDAGTYVFTWDGNATVRFTGDFPTQTISSGRAEITVTTPTAAGISYRVLSSELGNGFRNFKAWRPGKENGPEFDPAYIAAIGRVQMIRTMQWQSMNDPRNPLAGTAAYNATTPDCSWSQRARITAQNNITPEKKGMPIERIVALANAAKKDIYICIPHRASNTGTDSAAMLLAPGTGYDYVYQLALYIQANLDPALRVYFEVSNECWNQVGGQHAYFREFGFALGLNNYGNFSGSPSDPSVQSWTSRKMLVRRTAEVSLVLESVFGTRDSNNPRWSMCLGIMGASGATPVGGTPGNPNFRGTDARECLANLQNANINPFYNLGTEYHVASRFVHKVVYAPYFGRRTKTAITNNVAIPIGTLMDSVEADADLDTAEYTANNFYWTDQYGIDLEMYEGGFDAVHTGGVAQNNRMIDCRRHARMQDAYDLWHAAARNNGCKQALHLGLIVPPSISGAWGVLEHQNQDPSTSPTWLAREAELDYLETL